MPSFMSGFMKLLSYIFIILTGVVWQLPAAEYDAGVSNDDLISRHKASYELQPLTGPLFGENISLQNGDVSFSNIDLTIAGDIPIHLSRSYRGRQHAHFNSGDLADWSLDIPAIHTTMLRGRDQLSGFWGKNQACSGPLNPGNILTTHGSTYFSHEYWNGDTINVPGYTQGKLLESSSLGQTSRYTAAHWKIFCIDNGPARQQGFLAKSPDGLSWTFNQYMTKAGPTKVKNFKGSTIVYGYVYLTEVKDERGNWLKYHYSGNKLQSITSSDDRLVQFFYHADGAFSGRLEKVRYASKEINYQYFTSPQGGYVELKKVFRPDGKFWSYETANYHTSSPTLNLNSTGNVCGSAFDETLNSKSISVIHPEGAKLVLHFSGQKFRRANTPPTHYSDAARSQPIVPECSYKWALTSKTLTNPADGSQYTWSYRYSGSLSLANWDVYTALPEKTAFIRDNQHRLAAVQLIEPDGSQQVSFFDISFTSALEGKKLAEYTLGAGNQLLQRKTHSYVTAGTIGYAELEFENNAPDDLQINLYQTVTRSYGDETAELSETFIDYDIYGNVLKKLAHNSADNRKKYTKYSYLHGTTAWRIGLPVSESVSADDVSYTEVSRTQYYPADSEFKFLPQHKFYFGRLQQTYAYHPTGEVKRIDLALPGRWLEFHQYRFGKPRIIRQPHRYNSQLYQDAQLGVDEFGRVTRLTDFNGVVIDYGFDQLDRLTSITPDSQWQPTLITYENAIPAGVEQLVTRGSYRKKTQFDSLLRPLLFTEWDDNSVTQTFRVVRKSFNHHNNIIFESLPQSDVSLAVTGTSFSYDALNRLTKTVDAVGNIEHINYLNGFKKALTDARGHVTKTRYLAFGQPAYQQPVLIEQPEAVNTGISYDLFGNIEQVTQGGLVERRLYDGYRQLCLITRPETGTSVFQYNTVGEIQSYSHGLSGAARHCSDYTAVASHQIDNIYDNLGELHQVRYADGTATVQYTYDQQGRLRQLSNGYSVWDYEYNSANLLEEERLTTDNLSWRLDYSYNRLGHLESLTYPSGEQVTYSPDALGRATQAGAYAVDVRYHPNGLVHRFNYGNGVAFSQTLDPMQRPMDLLNTKAGHNKTSHSYRYDGNHNISDIFDFIDRSKDIRLTYDDVDRLDTANGSWGNGSFSYDSTGNLLTKNLGTQQLVYGYDPLTNRLSTVTGHYNFGYDDRGNVTSNGHRSFVFNRANQLTSSGNVSYVYDGHNRRIKKNAATASYSVYNKNGQLLLTDGPQGITRYIYLGSQLIARSGNAAATEDKPGYTGHLEDDDLSLTYMQQRYYDPVIGRFYSNDPVGFTASNPMMFNRYAYANNNPYKYTDPDGRTAIPFPLTPTDTGIGPTGVQDLTPEQQTQGAAIVAGALAGGLALNGAKAAVMSLASRTTTVGRGQQVGQMIKSDGSTKASDIKAKAESVGFKPTQSANGPLKMVDENGTARVTIKAGSERTPGSEGPHVELKDSSGQRVNPAGEAVTRSSPGNHTPITNDL